MRVCFCVWCVKYAKYLVFDTFERADENALTGRKVKGNSYLLPCLNVFKISKGKGVISHSSYLDVLEIRVERRGNNLNRQIYPYLKMDLQYWSIINLSIL